MNAQKIRDTHNSIINILNKRKLSDNELVTVLAQLLIYSGGAITKKDINIFDMNIEELYQEYYLDNKNNDIGLGLILNGVSIMDAITEKIEGNEIAKGDSDVN